MCDFNIYRNIEDIPDSKGPGIYAFYLDLNIFGRYAAKAREKGMGKVNLNSPFLKTIRSHTLTKQSNIDINLYGKSGCNYLSLTSDHKIEIDYELRTDDIESFEEFSRVVSFCILMSSPLYIGITERSFNERIDEHKEDYTDLSSEERTIDEDKEAFSPEGNLYEQVYKRNLTFNDLSFACVSVDEDTNRETLEFVETFLQSIANPPLSISH